MSQPKHHDFILEPLDNERLASLCGPFDAHLRQIEGALGVEIANRGNIFRISGQEPAASAAVRLLQTDICNRTDDPDLPPGDLPERTQQILDRHSWLEDSKTAV